MALCRLSTYRNKNLKMASTQCARILIAAIRYTHIFQLNRESSKEGNTHIINCVRIWNEIEIESSRNMCVHASRVQTVRLLISSRTWNMPLTKETSKKKILCTFLPRRKWIIRILFAAKSLDSAPLCKGEGTRMNEKKKSNEAYAFFVVDYFW